LSSVRQCSEVPSNAEIVHRGNDIDPC
jgi:hypothetical protein